MAQFCGIYEIFNTANGRRYIGQTVNSTKRFSRHRRMLQNGKHDNQHLQNAWNKHGADAFKFRCILTCQPSMLTYYEQQLFDKAKPEYNKAPAAGSRLGTTMSAESRAKISAALKGKKKSLSHVRAASAWERSPEFCAAITARQTGVPKSPETVAKIVATKARQRAEKAANSRVELVQ